MADLQFERGVYDSGDLGRRLAVCVGLSMLLHVSLVVWMKYEPVAVSLAEPKNTFAFDGSLRHTLQQMENIVARSRRSSQTPVKPVADRQLPMTPQPNTVVPAEKPPRPDNAVPVPDERPARRIDFDQARRVAREYERRTVDPRFNAEAGAANALETETPAQRELAKAARPDCRNEYAGMGIFAIPALLRDTVTNTGCKW